VGPLRSVAAVTAANYFNKKEETAEADKMGGELGKNPQTGEQWHPQDQPIKNIRKIRAGPGSTASG
jgi:hypothetical protein